MDDDLIRKFNGLTARKLELEGQLEPINDELKELQPLLLAEFERSGAQHYAVGGRTVYLERKLWAKAKDGDMERAKEALKAAGLGDYVSETFSTQSLSALYREWERDEVEPPPELEAAIETTEKFTVKSRAS